MNVLNYTRGSSQVIRKLSFFCVQVADEVDIILPGPVKIFLLVSISSAYQRNQSLHYQITTKHIFCRKPFVLTLSPRLCHSPQCCWWLWSSLKCCCHPEGSPPLLSDSPPPGHRLTAPGQQRSQAINELYLVQEDAGSQNLQLLFI